MPGMGADAMSIQGKGDAVYHGVLIVAVSRHAVHHAAGVCPGSRGGSMVQGQVQGQGWHPGTGRGRV